MNIIKWLKTHKRASMEISLFPPLHNAHHHAEAWLLTWLLRVCFVMAHQDSTFIMRSFCSLQIDWFARIVYSLKLFCAIFCLFWNYFIIFCLVSTDCYDTINFLLNVSSSRFKCSGQVAGAAWRSRCSIQERNIEPTGAEGQTGSGRNSPSGWRRWCV